MTTSTLARVPNDPASFQEMRGQMVFACVALMCYDCGDILPVLKKTGIVTEEEALCAAVMARGAICAGIWIGAHRMIDVKRYFTENSEQEIHVASELLIAIRYIQGRLWEASS